MTRLVDASRIVPGDMKVDRRPVPVKHFVARGVDVAIALIQERHHHLAVDVADFVVDGDQERLAQVMAHLLTNAATHTEPGGHITVSARREGAHGDGPHGDGPHGEGAYVVLDITDDGNGIAADLLPVVFDLPTSAPETLDRPPGGLGRGLTIVRTIVELHGGTIDAATAGVGQGSVFTLRLLETAENGEVADSGAPSPPFGGATSKRILVVDDSEMVVESLSEVLRLAGHEVISASNAARALELAEQTRFDVAILDIGLPEVDGYELAARLRAASGSTTPFLIAFSGYGQNADRERGAAAGFDVHLTKPCNIRGLLDVVASCEQPG